GGRQFAGRIGGMLHHQSFRCTAFAAPLPGDNQSHREPAVGSTAAHAQRLPLARRRHGAALGGGCFPGYGEEFSSHHGLPRLMATEGDLGSRKPQLSRRSRNMIRGTALRPPTKNGTPSGPYRGYYISMTSLQQGNVRDLRNPKKYIDATKIP